MGTLAGVWLIAWGMLALAVAGATGVLLPIFEQRGLELPWATVATLTAGDALRAGWGLLPLAGALALGLAPVAVLPRSAAVRRWLALGLVQGGLVALVLAGALAAPFFVSQRCLCDAWRQGRGFELDDAVSMALVACAGIAALQAYAWGRLSLEALRAPRGPAEREVARAAVLGLVPAALAAGLAWAAVEALVGSRPLDPLLVPAPVAAASTAVALVYGAALWLRAGEA